ncbi:hypothetical protein VN97_g9112 [Penicillium thymicola]|uniref:Uncharacterized protein n=1 Tax=Penicillium thymicola TaxID=293382 RepID=A0AAI9TC74_PENTH|nr:hypothetical protein VN97_g9112 [Penicillium thymicola]
MSRSLRALPPGSVEYYTGEVVEEDVIGEKERRNVTGSSLAVVRLRVLLFLALPRLPLMILCFPPPLVVGKGLEHIQYALQMSKAGVSATKLVVEL